MSAPPKLAVLRRLHFRDAAPLWMEERRPHVSPRTFLYYQNQLKVLPSATQTLSELRVELRRVNLQQPGGDTILCFLPRRERLPYGMLQSCRVNAERLWCRFVVRERACISRDRKIASEQTRNRHCGRAYAIT